MCKKSRSDWNGSADGSGWSEEADGDGRDSQTQISHLGISAWPSREGKVDRLRIVARARGSEAELVGQAPDTRQLISSE